MAEDPAQKTVRLRIYGRVQGVFYRAWMVGEATRRGIRGWVRNRSDGTVEALVSGQEARAHELIALCRVGPPRAAVSRIEIADADETEISLFGPGFTQAPTV